VVVTSGTTEREPHKGRSCCVGPISERLVAQAVGIEPRLVHQRTECVKTSAASSFLKSALLVGRNVNSLRVEVKITGPMLVAGDLLLNKAIVWLVVVERFDNVVAIAPCIAVIDIGLEAARA